MPSFHDLEPGDLFRMGPILVTRSDVFDHARRFGPGPALTGPVERGAALSAAPEASPLLTLSLVMGALFRELRAQGVAAGDRLQFEELHFPSPVRAGDRLTAEAEVAAKQVVEGATGLVHLRLVARNQERAAVLDSGLALFLPAVPRVRVVARHFEDR